MRRSWSCVSVAACLTLSGVARAGGAGDGQATALFKDAMDRDYLAMEFDKVEKKLRQADAICKKPGCSPAVSAQVHGYLAVLEGLAHKDKEKATEELRQMLRIDFTRTLDKQYASLLLKDAFDIAKEDVGKELEAKKQTDADEAKKADEAKQAEHDKKLREPPPVGKLVEKPFTEQAVTYPVPVVVKIPAAPAGIDPEQSAVTRVVVDYTGPGGQHGQAELKPSKDGYGGEIPCDGVLSAGKLTYFTTALNRFDNPVATGGTAAAPHTVVLKVALSGALPHLPGELPPRACPEAKESCKVASDCGSEGLECVKGECKVRLLAPFKPPPPPVEKKRGCGACRVSGGEGPETGGLLASLAMLGAFLARRSRRPSLNDERRCSADHSE
jgi:MYXO-CTERM domain-containing protein